MDNRLDKNMENEMGIGIVQGFRGYMSQCQYSAYEGTIKCGHGGYHGTLHYSP